MSMANFLLAISHLPKESCAQCHHDGYAERYCCVALRAQTMARVGQV